MMNKLLTKTTKKLSLLCLIMVVIVALATVFTAIFGANTATRMSDQMTVTVKMSAVYYRDDKKRENVEEVCEKAFDDLRVKYVYASQMSGDDCELVYVFKAKANEEKAAKAWANVVEAEKALKATFAGEDYEGAFITVESARETVQTVIAAATIVRTAIAIAVFAALAFVYMWIATRNLLHAITTAAAILLTAILSAAIVLLTRIPVTSSVLYAFAVAPLLAAVFAGFGVRNYKANETAESEEEKIVKAVAVKETLATVTVLGGALMLVFAIATWAARWFALSSLIGLLVAAAVTTFVVPALQLPLFIKKAALDAQRTKSGYVGAKKATEEEQE